MSDPHGNEEWRPVVGYEGFYSVSNHGRVRRDCGGYGARSGKILVPIPSKSGHLHVMLSVYGKLNSRQIHRLVLIAFVGPSPSPLHECRHLDGNPRHNHVGNLLWGTKAENAGDRKRHGTSAEGTKSTLAKLTEAEVEVILCLRKRGWTQIRIATAFCVSQQLISGIIRGIKWAHVSQ